MTTNLYTHPIYLEHLTPPGHPERPERLRALLTALDHEDFNPLARVESPRGSEESVLLAHPEEFLAKVASAIPEEGLARIDGDTVASPKSFDGLSGISNVKVSRTKETFSVGTPALENLSITLLSTPQVMGLIKPSGGEGE